MAELVKRSYASVAKGLQRTEFQPDPSRVAKKIFDESLHSSSLGTVSKFKGKPGIKFSESETSTLAQSLKFALVGKFSHGIPPLNPFISDLPNLALKVPSKLVSSILNTS